MRANGRYDLIDDLLARARPVSRNEGCRCLLDVIVV